MISVLIENQAINATEASWSSVDPGGFEACSFAISSKLAYPRPGSDIKIYDGIKLVWEGRVEEPGDNFTPHAATRQVSGVGYGARLRDDTMQMIFIDRDLSHWQGLSVARRVALGTAYNPQNDGTITTDATDGSPVIKLDLTGHIPGASGGLANSMYDAGSGNLISQVQFAVTDVRNTGGGGGWHTKLQYDDEDSFIGATQIDYGSGTEPFTRQSITASRFVLFELLYDATFTANEDERWSFIENVAVIGNHGVTLQQNGAGSDGYYPADIANYVRSQASSIDAGTIGSSTSFAAIHIVYKDRATYEQIIDDMAKFMGWHWGVWESKSKFRSTPRLDFCARPSSANTFTSRFDCGQISLSKSLSSMYNRARVAYTDPFGNQSFVTVTRQHPDLFAATRTIDLNIGIGTSTTATTYGNQVLALSQSDTRAQGSVDLPPTVDTSAGPMPSHFLRAGLNRICINGLPSISWTEQQNAYRIKRVSSVLTGDNVKTTIEIDNGADLIEVLQARLGQAAFGSVGGGKSGPTILTGPR